MLERCDLMPSSGFAEYRDFGCDEDLLLSLPPTNDSCKQLEDASKSVGDHVLRNAFEYRSHRNRSLTKYYANRFGLLALSCRCRGVGKTVVMTTCAGISESN